jgi:hypothetical protein
VTAASGASAFAAKSKKCPVVLAQRAAQTRSSYAWAASMKHAPTQSIPSALSVRQLSNDAQLHGRRAIDERAILDDRIPPGPNGLRPAVETRRER